MALEERARAMRAGSLRYRHLPPSRTAAHRGPRYRRPSGRSLLVVGAPVDRRPLGDPTRTVYTPADDTRAPAMSSHPADQGQRGHAHQMLTDPDTFYRASFQQTSNADQANEGRRWVAFVPFVRPLKAGRSGRDGCWLVVGTGRDGGGTAGRGVRLPCVGGAVAVSSDGTGDGTEGCVRGWSGRSAGVVRPVGERDGSITVHRGSPRGGGRRR